MQQITPVMSGEFYCHLAHAGETNLAHDSLGVQASGVLEQVSVGPLA